jgi:hypothetical protein
VKGYGLGLWTNADYLVVYQGIVWISLAEVDLAGFYVEGNYRRVVDRSARVIYRNQRRVVLIAD